MKSGVAFPFLVNEDIVAINGIVYFNAGPTNSDIELWKSDGTDAGTTRVKDIRAGSLGSSPSQLMAVDGVLYFLAVTAPRLEPSSLRISPRARPRPARET